MKHMTLALAAAAALQAMPGAAAAPAPRAADVNAVKATLAAYKGAIERLDAKGTERLFVPDSMIFETGGSEGTYANYLGHHLGPELGEFKSFKFDDYKVSVRFEGPVAIATESYTYHIVTKKGDAADRLGVATSVLRKQSGQWKIVMMHNSARRPKP